MQSALSEDDWRPGFAKRAPNFDAVCEQARAWRWSPGESIARIAAAVLKGTPTLTIQQRMTLLLYVEHLNQDRLEKDVACVWPSTALIAAPTAAPIGSNTAPINGCGNGAVSGGLGITTRWTSMPSTGSPHFAAVMPTPRSLASAS